MTSQPTHVAFVGRVLQHTAQRSLCDQIADQGFAQVDWEIGHGTFWLQVSFDVDSDLAVGYEIQESVDVGQE